MFADALVEANPYYKFLEVIKDPARYVKFNDNTLVLIGKSNKTELQKSKSIIQRVYSRDLYKCIGEVAVPIKDCDQFFEKIFTLENIVSYHDGAPDDL